MAPRKKCGRVCRAQLSAAQGDEMFDVPAPKAPATEPLRTWSSLVTEPLKKHGARLRAKFGNYPERSEMMQLVGIEPFKTCTFCGRTFTKAEWDALPLVGHQRVEAGDGEPALLLELKNCPNDNSTQAVPVVDARGSLGAVSPVSFIAHAEQLLRAHNFVPAPNFRAREAKFWSFYSDHFQLGIYLWEHGAEFWIWEFLVGPGGPTAIHMNGEVHAQDFDRGLEAALATLDSLETKWEPR